MTAPNIIDGRLHSPHFVCVRDDQVLGDGRLLDVFGISSFQRLIGKKPLGHYAVIFDAEDWTVVADSWYYNLWHSPRKRSAVEVLARDYELYVCSVGDCDLSYAFEYHKAGQLRRKRVVESPRFSDQIVTVDLGTPLVAEAEIWDCDFDDALRIQLLGESLGIPLTVSDAQLRTYCVIRGDEG